MCVCVKMSDRIFITMLTLVTLATKSKQHTFVLFQLFTMENVSFYSKYIVLKENTATCCHNDKLKIEIYLHTCSI